MERKKQSIDYIDRWGALSLIFHFLNTFHPVRLHRNAEAELAVCMQAKSDHDFSIQI